MIVRWIEVWYRLVWLAMTACGPSEPEEAPANTESPEATFMADLPGQWSGTAILTPLGELPYDLDVQVLDDGSVQGTSTTNGRAIHTWLFRRHAPGALTLDFHTTFGDSGAEGLRSTQIDPVRGIRFSGGRPEHLSLWIRTFDDGQRAHWQAEIFLRDQPHVTIHATRPLAR